MKRFFLSLIAAVALVGAVHAQNVPPTLPANTSANPSTPAFSNGTLAGNTNVSDVDIHSLLYPGNTTQVLVHYLPWMTNSTQNGVNVQYNSTDPNYVKGFLDDIKRRGIDGAMVDWQGQSDFMDRGTLVLQQQIQSYTTWGNKPMTFAIVLDANFLSNGSQSGSTNQAKVLNALKYITGQYLSDPHYLVYNGKPVVMDFGLTAASGINWTTVQNQYPNVQLVHLDNATSPDGFGIAKSGGSFLWLTPTSQDVTPPDLSNIDDFYTRSNNHPSQITIGAAYKGFNSQYAPWDGQVYIDQQCGQTWLNTFAKINQYFNSAHQLPFLQLVTWDDYYEGTPLETGIDNCLSLNVSQNARTINIQLTGNGSTNTLQDIELWSQTNGTWGFVTYPSNTTSIAVPGPGTYYIKTAGKPMFKDLLSQPIVIN